MLSEKLVDFFKQQGWWYDDASSVYAQALQQLGVDLDSDFARFHLHVEDGPTFIQRGRELYQLGWFVSNTNYDLALQHAHDTLGLPRDYLPLDSFEGESGCFYNRSTGEVLRVSLGGELMDFREGRLAPQWPTFNDFLAHYFQLDASPCP